MSTVWRYLRAARAARSMVAVGLCPLYWGDHRSLRQYEAYDHVQRERWRLRVGKREAQHRGQLTLAANTMAVAVSLLRRQAE